MEVSECFQNAFETKHRFGTTISCSALWKCQKYIGFAAKWPSWASSTGSAQEMIKSFFLRQGTLQKTASWGKKMDRRKCLSKTNMCKCLKTLLLLLLLLLLVVVVVVVFDQDHNVSKSGKFHISCSLTLKKTISTLPEARRAIAGVDPWVSAANGKIVTQQVV